jgi:hypothetical protein
VTALSKRGISVPNPRHRTHASSTTRAARVTSAATQLSCIKPVLAALVTRVWPLVLHSALAPTQRRCARFLPQGRPQPDKNYRASIWIWRPMSPAPDAYCEDSPSATCLGTASLDVAGGSSSQHAQRGQLGGYSGSQRPRVEKNYRAWSQTCRTLLMALDRRTP